MLPVRFRREADLFPRAGMEGGLSSILLTSIMDEVERLAGRMDGCRAVLGAGVAGGGRESPALDLFMLLELLLL